MEQRPYFAYAVYDLRRWRFLLFVPLIRMAAAVLHGELPTVHRYGPVVGAALVGYVWLKWRSCRYRLSALENHRSHVLEIRQGICTQKTLRVSAEDAASVEIERTPLLWLLRGRRILISTAGLRRRADALLYLSSAQARHLFSLKHHQYDYRAVRWPILVMALTGSNAAVGLLTISPVLRHSGKLLGNSVTQEVVGKINRLAELGLSPLLPTIGNVLLAGWLVSAVRNFLRYEGFRAYRDEHVLHLSSGLLTHRDILIDQDKITALELRQTLTMRLWSLQTAIVTAAGYGRSVGTRPVLIPAARPRDLSDCLDRLLPGFPINDQPASPSRRSCKRYIAPPLLLLLVGSWLWFFGGWWYGLSALWMLFSLWWLVIRGVGFCCAGFGYDASAVLLCYPRGLAVYRVYLPRSSVDCVIVTRSRNQRRNGLCTVTVRCFGEKKRTHRVWGLPYETVKEMLQS